MAPTDPVVVAAVRTPFGKFRGSLATVSAIDLGAIAIRAALERAGVAPAAVDHCIMGTVVAAGLGQVPARQAALRAGLPPTVPALTVNKVCASSLKAVNLAALLIRAGEAEVVVAGGMESMTQAPRLLSGTRRGVAMGPLTLADAMLQDGLTCPVDGVHMGEHGHAVAEELGVSREAQDAYALRSQQRYEAARQAGWIAEELVPVPVPAGAGGPALVDRDEQPRPDTTAERLAGLRPVFGGASGTITAGNAPGINDGAAVVVLMSRARAAADGCPVLATWVGSGEVGAEHPYLATVPALALERALARTGGVLTAPDLAVVEINEAFAAVVLTSSRMLGLDLERVNPNGGAIAVGHPIGASGARILGSLVHELRRRGGGYGAATICSGLAQGEATLVRVD
ncbi:MAG TPA: acetyl-CoA C-acyltransferase [Candidatus Dormibacteraeota bacterium]|nr:acetyl-CoA C-acyltransferase [Candidatus Dormibacteraeota bacterium]